MQVSTDGAVQFVARGSGTNQEGRAYYNVSVSDGENVMRVSCDEKVYSELLQCVVGDYLHLVLNVREFRSGLSVRAVDVVIGE